MDYLIYPSQDNIVLHQFHCIVPTYLDKKVVQNGIRRVLKKFGRTSVLLSFIRRLKYNCITKEQFDEMYQTNLVKVNRVGKLFLTEKVYDSFSKHWKNWDSFCWQLLILQLENTSSCLQ